MRYCPIRTAYSMKYSIRVICRPNGGENIICPLYKSGASKNPENYRGISLINSIGKFVTRILTTQLQKWPEENWVIDEPQAGYRKGYSTTDNIFRSKQLVRSIYVAKEAAFWTIF